MLNQPTMAAIRERIRELEAQLAADPAYRELAILREAEKKLGDLFADDLLATASQIIERQIERRKQKDTRVTILAASKAALEASGRPLPTKTLLDALPAHGATVGGKQPQIALTSILSKRGETIGVGNIAYQGGRAWWFTDRPITRGEAA